MKQQYWTLDADGRTPVPTDDVMRWGKWFTKANRVLAQTTLADITVSTVFLGLNHNFSPDPKAPPVLWETMVFGGILDGTSDRYATYEQAESGHGKMVLEVLRRGG